MDRTFTQGESSFGCSDVDSSANDGHLGGGPQPFILSEYQFQLDLSYLKSGFPR